MKAFRAANAHPVHFPGYAEIMDHFLEVLGEQMKLLKHKSERAAAIRFVDVVGDLDAALAAYLAHPHTDPRVTQRHAEILKLLYPLRRKGKAKQQRKRKPLRV